MKLAAEAQQSVVIVPLLQFKKLVATPYVCLDYKHPYLLGRGVEPAVAEQFGFGVSSAIYSVACRVFFSIHDPHGNFVDWATRVLDESEPKYQFPAGFTKMSYLYNYHRARAVYRQAVIVVEGFFDAVKVYQAGYPSVVALMGSTMSEAQEYLLLRWWEYVIFMLDGDVAGRRMQKEAIGRLNKHGLKGVFGINLPDRVQPDSLTPEQVRTFLATSS